MILQVSPSFSISVRHLWRKGNSFYYRRRYPSDIACITNKSLHVVHLNTLDPIMAAQLALQEASKDDQAWALLRGKSTNIPTPGTTPSAPIAATQPRPDTPSPVTQSSVTQPAAIPIVLPATPTVITASQARDLYLELRAGDAGFQKVTTLAFKELTDTCGDRPVETYRRDDVNRLVASMLARGSSTATVRRRLKSLNAGFGLVIREKELDITNPFIRVIIPNEGSDEVARPVFSTDELQLLRSRCNQRDDDIGDAILLLTDTGARLAEVIGATVADAVLDAPIPYLDIQPHSWRRLKTKGARRKVPLTGSALEAAKRLVERSQSTDALLFPRYTTQQDCATNTASQTLNKYIRSLGIDKTCHSLRHTMRDRLRAVQCPTEIVDRIGGWQEISTAGTGYGEGYPLAVLYQWLNSA